MSVSTRDHAGKGVGHPAGRFIWLGAIRSVRLHPRERSTTAFVLGTESSGRHRRRRPRVLARAVLDDVALTTVSAVSRRCGPRRHDALIGDHAFNARAPRSPSGPHPEGGGTCGCWRCGRPAPGPANQRGVPDPTRVAGVVVVPSGPAQPWAYRDATMSATQQRALQGVQSEAASPTASRVIPTADDDPSTDHRHEAPVGARSAGRGASSDLQDVLGVPQACLDGVLCHGTAYHRTRWSAAFAPVSPDWAT